MRILHIIPSYYPAFRFGGPIHSVHLLNKTVVKKGIQVDILTTNAGLNEKQKVQILRQAQDDKERWNDVDGVRVKYVSFVGYEHFNFSLSFVRELKKIIRDYDLVHITAIWNFPVLVGAYFCNKHSIPHIISPRGAVNFEAIIDRKKNIKNFYYKFFLKKVFRNAVFHFTSSLDYMRFIEYNKEDIKHIIIPNGFEVGLYDKNKIQGKKIIEGKYILYLGRINRLKGLELLIRAFNKIHKKYSNVSLIFAGPDNDQYKSTLFKIIKELSLENRAIFLGLLNFDEKLNAIYNCEFLVLPSYSENFGNVVIEALLCKKTVIIGKNVGVRDEISDNNAGLIVDYNENELASAMEHLLDDASYRNNLADNGFNYSQKFYDINTVTDRFINEYEKIIK